MSSINTMYKIALLGEEGVGKTALLVRFLCHRYIGEYDPSIEDIYRRHVKLDDEDLTVDFLDTSSRLTQLGSSFGLARIWSLSLGTCSFQRDIYRNIYSTSNTPATFGIIIRLSDNSATQRSETSMKESFIKRSDGFVLIYSMTDRSSFLAIPKYKNIIEKSRDNNSCPVPVVLVANKGDLHEHRTVSSKEGRRLAAQYGWTFAEVSAAVSDGVDKVFNELIRELQFKNNMMHLGNEHIERRRSLSLNGFFKHDSLKLHRLSDVSSSSPSSSSSDLDHSNSSLVLPHSKHSFNFKKLLHLRTDLNSRRGSH